MEKAAMRWRFDKSKTSRYTNRGDFGEKIVSCNVGGGVRKWRKNIILNGIADLRVASVLLERKCNIPVVKR
jgi:hypothetical protein